MSLKYLTIDDCKVRDKVYVTSDFQKLKQEWAEAEMGPMSDADLWGYCGCPGEITEVEEDDDTLQLQWITMDTQWIPAAACVRDLPEKDRKDAPMSFIPRLNGNEADNMEDELDAKAAASGEYIPSADEYLTISKAKMFDTIYVTSDFNKLKEEWKACDMGKMSDNDLKGYCGCPGKITEVEEDDDTVQLEWITMDTQWIPIEACVKNLPKHAKKDAPMSFIPRLNGTEADNMEDELNARMAGGGAGEPTYKPADSEYLTCETTKCGSTIYVTSDFKKLREEWEACGQGKMSDNDLKGYCGCPGKVLEVEEDDDTVQLEWITMDTQWIPVTACVKDLPKEARKDAPMSFIPRLNGTEADNMEAELNAKMAAAGA